MKIVLCIFFALALTQAEEFSIRRADIWTKQHVKCTVEQGSNLSFLSCPNTFEIYETDQIAISPYETEMYGELTPVVGAHASLEKLHSERITWVFNKNEIWTVE